METQEVIEAKEFSQARSIEPQGKRLKSSLRMRYMAEVKLLRQELGGLEEVRERLGLSRRKMCQLLLVDPSAWTRWTRDESKVPPHVWKMLWFLGKEKNLSQRDLKVEKYAPQEPLRIEFSLTQRRIFMLLLALLCSNFLGILFILV